MPSQFGESIPVRSAESAGAWMSPAVAQRMFSRVLAAWVLDCARLRRAGLDRPMLAPGHDGVGEVLGDAARAEMLIRGA